MTDLDQHLARTDSVGADELLELVCDEQLSQWRQGHRIPAETFLHLHPTLGRDPEAVFAVIYTEYAVRQQLGESPSVDEFRWRFPQLAERMQRQMRFHWALFTDGKAHSSTTSRNGQTRTCEHLSQAAGATTGTGTADYEILSELGRGGMGVVYKARQVSLDRLVALKMISAGSLADPEQRARFHAEAGAVARLQHPNIVQIHEVAETNGQPFLALELVSSGSLAEHFTGAPLAVRAAAQLVKTLASAAHYAHGQGIVHRDLKPANVLLATSDRTDALELEFGPESSGRYELKVTDFGLAKLLPSFSTTAGDISGGQTQTGAILGTPSYMAPEQADGHASQIGPATDVYSLGAILYEALTGRAPFHGRSMLDTLEQVRTQTPVSVRRLQPRVPRDAETICLKCLRKEPAKRYASAESLALDLDRFLQGKPIHAQVVSNWERGVMWARREPKLAAMLLALVALTIMALVSLTWGYLATQNRAQEAVRRAQAESRGASAERARAELEATARGVETVLRREAQHRLSETRVALAERELLAHNIAGAKRLLDLCRPLRGEPDQRAWEWYYLDKLCHGELAILQHRSWVTAVAFSPDGRLLATASGVPAMNGGSRPNGEVTLWNAETHEELATLTGPPIAPQRSVRFSPNGRWLLARDDVETWRVWRVTDRQLIAELPAVEVAFLDDGQTLGVVASDGELTHVSLASGQHLRAVRPAAEGAGAAHRDRVSAGFDMNGQHVAIGQLDNTLLDIVDTQSGKTVKTLTAPGYSHSVRFSHQGHRLIVGDRLLNFDTGRDLGSLGQMLSGVLFSRNDQWLARFDWDSPMIARGDSGQVVQRLFGHSGAVNDLAFSPSGDLLASAGTDRTVRLWSVPTGKEVRVLSGHSSGVRGIAFSPDGRRLASTGQDHTVRIWDLTSDPRGMLIKSADYGEFNGPVAFSSDSRRLLWVRHFYTPLLRERDLATGSEHWRHVNVPVGLALVIGQAAFSGDGELLVSASNKRPQTVKIWRTTSGHSLHSLYAHTMPVQCVAIDTQGHCVASMAYQSCAGESHFVGLRFSSGQSPPDPTSELVVWNGKTGQPLLVLEPPPARCLALSHDGQLLAAAAFDGTIWVWDTASGQEVSVNSGRHDTVVSLAFSADSRLLAAGGWGGVSIYDTAEPLRLRQVLSTSSRVTCVTFSPDGRRLATTGMDGVVRLWDPATGHRVFTLRGFAPWRTDDYFYLARVVFSPDGKRLAANNWDSSISVWDASPLAAGSVGSDGS